MAELVFLVEEASEGGFIAWALGYSIATDGETFEELQARVKDAVRCHFEEGAGPVVVMTTVKAGTFSKLSQPSPTSAAELACGLVSGLPKGASIEDLERLEGILDDEAAREMMAAIKDGCERLPSRLDPGDGRQPP